MNGRVIRKGVFTAGPDATQSFFAMPAGNRLASFGLSFRDGMEAKAEQAEELDIRTENAIDGGPQKFPVAVAALGVAFMLYMVMR